MRILFLTQYFQPEPNFFLGLPFAKELVRRGHEVEVLTGFPNYPGGKIYHGYKIKYLQRELMEGIPVIRVPLYPSHDRSSMKRILNYSSFAFSSSTIGSFCIKPADVCFVYQGPATLGWAATIFRLLHRIPFVWNIQDLWPDSLASTGMFDHKLGLSMVNGWCNFIYKKASKIVVITPGMKKKLMERGVPGDKVEIIYNWCDDALICRDDKNEVLASSLGMANKFNIVFAGNMGKAQALGPVFDAAKILGDECPDAQFVFIGDGVEVEPLKQKTKALQLSNVLFLARRPVSEIGPILRLADALLVHLRDDPLFRITIPSKTQAYMAMGRPVLMGVKGDAAELIEKARAGISCEPENPVSIAATVKKLYHMTASELDNMGNNGMRYYDQNMAFEIGVEKYEKIFNTVKQ